MPPSLPSRIKGVSVTKADGSQALVVSTKDAATLMAISRRSIESWIDRGRVTVCVSPRGETMVFVDSLWAQVPEEFQR